MEQPGDRALLRRCYEASNPLSRLSVKNNYGLLMFYCFGFMKDCVYYSEREGPPWWPSSRGCSAVPGCFRRRRCSAAGHTQRAGRRENPEDCSGIFSAGDRGLRL